MPARTNRIGLWLGAYGNERRGAAGVEFAVVLALLLIPILNVIDFGVYLFQNMELAAATDAAAQAALFTCGWNNLLPAYGTNGSDGYCPSLITAATTAAQSTSLGTGVTVSFPATRPEAYYCVQTGGGLAWVATPPTSPPSDCSANGGSANDVPGDYLQITASYTYAPLFTGISIASAFPTPIVRTVWVRLR